MSNKKTYYNFLDLCRLYCALLIIIIHMGFGNDFAIVPCLTRQGVPFFFLVSGFFFAKTLNRSNNILQTSKEYILRIFLLYCAWALLWTPYSIIEYRDLYPDSFLKIVLVMVRRYLFAGMAQYWYLLVLTEGFICLTYVINRKWWRLGFALSIFGFVLYIIYTVQVQFFPDGLTYRVFYTLFSWSNNIIMTGFPLLFWGALAERYESRIKNRINIRVLAILYVLSIVVAFVHFYINSKLMSVLPYGPVQAVILFIICIYRPSFESKIPKSIGKNARDLSGIIYLTHTIILLVLGSVFHIWNNLYRFTVAVVIACVLLIAVRKTSNSAIKWLFMLR